jgi:DNA-binding transcriptional LysR family regulator
MSLNSRQIETFYAVMKTGSVTEAANSLNVTQPAVTASLKQIETALGFNLFHRASGRLHPTAEAKILFNEAARLHDSIQVFEKLSERLKSDLTTHLRIAAPPAFCHQLIPNAITAFSMAEADSMIDVTTQHSEGILADLSSEVGRNNLGFTFGTDDRKGLGSMTLGKAEIQALVPANLPHLHGAELEITDLHQQPVVGWFHGEPLADAVKNMVESAGITPLYRARAHSHAVAADLASQGVGIAIIDNITARYAQKTKPRDSFKIRPVRQAPTLPITAVYSYEHPLSNKAKAFIEAFRKALRSS